DQGLPVRGLVIGKVAPEYRRQLDADITRLALGERVVFRDFAPVVELPGWLSALDIAVWPGDISNTAIEAMSVGLPVVAARTPYTEAVIERYGAGALFDVEDEYGLAEALAPLVADEHRRHATSQCARMAVATDLNWRGITRQWLALYEGLPDSRHDDGLFASGAHLHEPGAAPNRHGERSAAPLCHPERSAAESKDL